MNDENRFGLKEESVGARANFSIFQTTIVLMTVPTSVSTRIRTPFRCLSRVDMSRDKIA